MNRTKRQQIFAYLPVTSLALCIVLFYWFPLSGDDWTRAAMNHRGLLDHIDSIINNWQTLNGRVLGNLFSTLWIGHFPRIIIRLLCVVGIWQTTHRIFRIKKSTALIFTLAMILLLPKEIFREVWGWSSGFFNYVPPIVLLLVAMAAFLDKDHFGRPRNVLLFTTTFASCLFMENFTLYVVLLSIAFAAYHFQKERSLTRVWPLLLGAILGAIVMFSSPIYWRVAQNADGYRSATLSLLDNWGIFSQFLLSRNYIFLLGTSLFFLYRCFSEKTWRGAAIILTILSLFIALSSMWETQEEVLWINLLVHIAYYLMLLILGIRTLQYDAKSRWAFLIVSLGLLMGQLLFVSPVGARNFFTPAVFYMMLLILLYKELGESLPLQQKQAKYLLLVLVIIKLLYFFPIYSANYRTFVERVDRVESAVESGISQVTIPAYPYEDYVHSPGVDKMDHMYYRQEREDVEIVVE